MNILDLISPVQPLVLDKCADYDLSACTGADFIPVVNGKNQYVGVIPAALLRLKPLPPEIVLHTLNRNIPLLSIESAAAGPLREAVVCKGKTICGIISSHSIVAFLQAQLQSVPSYKQQAESLACDLASMMASVADGFSITDQAGQILHINKAYETMTGLTGKDIVGKKMDALVKEKLYDQSITFSVLKQKKPITIRQTINGKNFVVTGNPFFDASGRLVRIVNNIRDITEMVQLQEKAEQLKKKNLLYETELSHLRSINTEASGIIHCSKIMETVIAMSKKAAQFDSTILITGESGTGKELIAKLIHTCSPRASKPFIKINCSAIPESLLESELFGYEKGSFTGAKREGKPGMFELANNGTFFLDEIGDMPLGFQIKLLRVLQEKEVMRIGGTKAIPINTRIIAATNQDLVQMVAQGTFRNDLYYRLLVVPIHLPPLRERPEDIPLLIHYFLGAFNKRNHCRKTIQPEALNQLLSYSWPGNIRELENLIERLIVLSRYEEITLTDLPSYVTSFRPERPPTPSSQAGSAKTSIGAVVSGAEADMLRRLYGQLRSWDKVAKELGVSRATIYRKAKKYHLIVRQSQ